MFLPQPVRMDKFGYIRGQRGPPGPRGRDALNIFTWLPMSALHMFRENETCTYYCDTAEDGILYKDKKPVGLKNQFEKFKRKSNGNKNAMCLQNFQQPVQLDSGYYGIFLKDSLYKISHVPAAFAPPSIMVVALSFRISATLTDADHYIFTNKSISRGVAISRNVLNILGSQYRMELEYDVNDWNTLIIQYSFITEPGKDQCIFILNGQEKGYFKLRYDKIQDKDIFIGGHPSKRNYGNVVLANFEIYNKIFDSRNVPSNYLLPDELFQALNDDMNERINYGYNKLN